MNYKKQTKNNFPWVWVFTFILAVLKVTGVANITWWVVFAPFWILVLIFIGIMVVTFIVGLAIALVEEMQKGGE